MSQVHFLGDFYYNKESAAPGQSPVTSPEKWQLLALPEEFLSAIATRAAAGIIDGLGNGDRATQLRTESEMLKHEAIKAAVARDGEVRQMEVVR